MKPLNAAARKKTFINFLVFFIVTATVMVATIFFSFQVPLKENDQLRSRVAQAQGQQLFSAEFADKMAETMKLLDSVNRSDMQTQAVRFDAGIDENLKYMNAMVLRDSALDKNFYQSVALSLGLLQHAQKQIRYASGKDSDINDQSKKIESLQNELRDAQAQLQICKLGNQQH